MKIMIAGGSGFVGRMLVPALLCHNHEVYVLGRHRAKIEASFPRSVQALEWSDLPGLDAADYDAIINLTGANIAEKRWTEATKSQILESRLTATSSLIDWCSHSSGAKPHLYNASAIGYYGLQGSIPDSKDIQNEDSLVDIKADGSFSCTLVNAWEACAKKALVHQIPLTIMRFGVVLHRAEGMLKQLEMPAMFGLGAIVGTGNQPISWISSYDLVEAIQFLLVHPEVTGVVNLVSPEIVSQRDFTKTLAKVIKRPAFLKMPVWVVKLLFGQMGEELLLSGQAVFPKRLMDMNFKFSHRSLSEALEKIFN